MLDELGRIKNHLKSGVLGNEAAIRQHVVVPLFAQLGWEVFDPAEVVPEYTTAKGRVDYALCVDGSPRVFVDVVLGAFQMREEPLLRYAFAEGIEMAVLTDGRRWGIYLSTEQVPFPERRVELLDMEDVDEKTAAAVLHRYLDHGAAKSKENINAARDSLRDVARRAKLVEGMPAAWASLLDEPRGLIAECLAERVEENVGARPDEEDVRRFLDLVPRPPAAALWDAPSSPSSSRVSQDAAQAFDAAAKPPHHNARLPGTTKWYRRRWLEFACWCESRGRPWLPADPVQVKEWIETNWPKFAAGTLTVDLSAIGLLHKANELPNPAARGSPAREHLASLKERERKDNPTSSTASVEP